MRAPGELLFLHTAEGEGFVAAAHAGGIAVEPLGRRDRRALVGAIQAALSRLGADPRTLRGILVTTGPGSFTGIRVGIATAQGLAAALGLRVWVCDSLEVEAAAFTGATEPLAIGHDARRGEVYAGLYDVSGASPRALVPVFCAAPGAAARLLREAAPARAVAGSGSSSLAAASAGWRVLEAPAPASVAGAAIRLAMQGSYADLEPRQVAPFYVRRPDVRPPRHHP